MAAARSFLTIYSKISGKKKLSDTLILNIELFVKYKKKDYFSVVIG